MTRPSQVITFTGSIRGLTDKHGKKKGTVDKDLHITHGGLKKDHFSLNCH